MNFLRVVLILAFCGLVACQINKFRAVFAADELDINNPSTKIRSYTGAFYYEDTWSAANPNGRQSMRFDISLNDGTTTRTLTELYVFQDQFFKYTICNGKCAWQDIFSEEPLPRLYINGDNPDGSSGPINGAAVTPYTITQENAIGYDFANWIRLYVRSQAPQYPVRAEIKYVGIGIIKKLDFSAQTTDFSSNVFNVPAGCPIITPGCFRVDLSVVLDVSGSVTNPGILSALDFLTQLVTGLLIDAKHVNVALCTFSYCSTISVKFFMLSDKQAILSQLNTLASPPQLQSEGWTCIVGGINQGFKAFDISNGGRPATRKSLLVITDGNGNRPCSTRPIAQFPGEDCQAFDKSVWGNPQVCCQSCNRFSGSPCNGEACCQQIHDWQLKVFYSGFYALYNPTIYAVGVGFDISDASLQNIVNDPLAIAAGQPRIFRVGSYFSLNTALTALAAALLCDVEGSETCPNDCRPGGFCCAGGCLCSVDCAIQSTACQLGICVADSKGARCELGLPDTSLCENPTEFCRDFTCVAGQGCVGTPNDNLTCTDFNACTVDSCQGGVCVSVKNDSVANCNDRNECTRDDACQPDGSCVGIPDDNQPCSDGNLCTSDRCFESKCVSVPDTNKTCPDTITTDCISYQCDPATGGCTPIPITPGFECRERPVNDNCTIYICDRFDVDDYEQCIANGRGEECNTGRCRPATPDLEECESSDINTAGIIGGAVAGAAFLAIVALAIIILIVFLLRKKVVDLLGTLNPFGQDVIVQDAGTYKDPMSSHTVPAAFGET